MKVIIVDPSMFTPQYDHHLCNALVEQQCDVTLVGCPLSEKLTPLSPRRYRYEAWFYNRSNRSSRNNPSYLRLISKGFEHLTNMHQLIGRIKKSNPDIIHFQWLPIPIIDNIFLPALRKIAPLVITVHDTVPFQGSPTTRIQRWRLWHALYNFDAWIVHTQHSKNELRRRIYIPSSRIFIIQLGIFDDYSNYAPNRGPEVDNSCRTILFFGILKPYKGLDVLIQALAYLSDEVRKNLKVLIVGLPRMNIRPLKALARDLNVDELIHWDLRFVPEKEIPHIFHQADLIVLPYRHVDQSGILMTALAFRKPVIMTRVGGFIELFQTLNLGLLVEPDNPAELAKAITELMTNYHRYHQIVQSINTLATEYLSWKKVAQKTIQVYEHTMKHRKKFNLA